MSHSHNYSYSSQGGYQQPGGSYGNYGSSYPRLRCSSFSLTVNRTIASTSSSVHEPSVQSKPDYTMVEHAVKSNQCAISAEPRPASSASLTSSIELSELRSWSIYDGNWTPTTSFTSEWFCCGSLNNSDYSRLIDDSLETRIFQPHPGNTTGGRLQGMALRRLLRQYLEASVIMFGRLSGDLQDHNKSFRVGINMTTASRMPMLKARLLSVILVLFHLQHYLRDHPAHMDIRQQQLNLHLRVLTVRLHFSPTRLTFSSPLQPLNHGERPIKRPPLHLLVLVHNRTIRP